MPIYFYVILVLFYCLMPTRAQTAKTKIYKNKTYQIYWYEAKGKICRNSDKYPKFTDAYKQYKMINKYRHPVMIINDPLVFRM